MQEAEIGGLGVPDQPRQKCELSEKNWSGRALAQQVQNPSTEEKKKGKNL
jgi:hypothetical protein